MHFLKIALGVIGRGCYLQETWNKLDCFIVISGYLQSSFLMAFINRNIYFIRAFEYFMDNEKLNLSAIRTVRVLRPLRAINRIPSRGA